MPGFNAVCHRSEAPNDAARGARRLPAELLVQIARLLAGAGQNRSLVNLMLAGRQSYAAGVPELVRDLDLRCLQYDQLEALAESCPDKFMHTRTLKVHLDSFLPSGLFDSGCPLLAMRILSLCTNLRDLTLSLGSTSPQWHALAPLSKLACLRVELWNTGAPLDNIVLPATVKEFHLSRSPFANNPIAFFGAESSNLLEALENSNATWSAELSAIDGLYLADNERATEKLTSVVLRADWTLREVLMNPAFKPKTMTVQSGFVEPDKRVWDAVANLGVEKLEIQMQSGRRFRVTPKAGKAGHAAIGKGFGMPVGAKC